MDFNDYQILLKQIPFGKRLPTALYLHIDGLPYLPVALQQLLEQAIIQFSLTTYDYQLIKFSTNAFKLSLLRYPHFFTDPFPALAESYSLDLATQRLQHRFYHTTANPPILHRKELFLPPHHPAIPAFRSLTLAAEQAGLFINTKTIGFKQTWEKLMQEKGFIPQIQRHLTAINRNALSRPLQMLFKHQFLEEQYSFFDYGCGKGDDLRELQAYGIEAQGFDPVYAPQNPKIPADIVNLGFVINVIENPQERQTCLQEAYQLSRQLLVVSVMLTNEARLTHQNCYGDGIITKRHTFQKYYTQMELKHYLETVLQTQAIAVASGIFYIFRDPLAEQSFLEKRQRQRYVWRQLTQRPNPEDATTRFQRHQTLLQPFWENCLEFGRCPDKSEFAENNALKSAFGSLRKAYQFVCNYFSTELLQQAEQARRHDLLIYFALNLFEKRKPYQKLPERLKRDVKAFFGDYKAAQQMATELLFSVGKPEMIYSACIQAQQQGIGYLLAEHSLQLHTSQINQLPPILRVYVGCATQLYGDVEEADLVKLHIRSGKVSLMKYLDFETSPLPILQERIKIKLRDQEIDFFDYRSHSQLLYWKSRYISTDFLHYEEQQVFDETLEKSGLFDLSGYGMEKEELEQILQKHNWIIEGWQLVKQVI